MVTTNINKLFDIRGKVAIVTGGSRGIGAMIAQGLVANGVRTYITAELADECEAKASELSAQGECIAMPCDLSTLAGIKTFVNTFNEREAQLDILVNNAGISRASKLADFPEADWDQVVDVNLKAPFFLVQGLLPKLRAGASMEEPARIINTASIAGILPPQGLEHYSYSASKSGVINLTRHLAINLAAEHIRVNAISPGIFPTQLTGHAKDGADTVLSDDNPCGRLGTGEDVVGAVIYLSSRAGAWITGVNIPVDGGAVIKR